MSKFYCRRHTSKLFNFFNRAVVLVSFIWFFPWLFVFVMFEKTLSPNAHLLFCSVSFTSTRTKTGVERCEPRSEHHARVPVLTIRQRVHHEGAHQDCIKEYVRENQSDHLPENLAEHARDQQPITPKQTHQRASIREALQTWPEKATQVSVRKWHVQHITHKRYVLKFYPFQKSMQCPFGNLNSLSTWLTPKIVSNIGLPISVSQLHIRGASDISEANCLSQSCRRRASGVVEDLWFGYSSCNV